MSSENTSPLRRHWSAGRNLCRSATPHEVTLVQQTRSDLFVAEPIERLIGDNAYDSDRLDRELADTGVEMIAPQRLT